MTSKPRPILGLVLVALAAFLVHPQGFVGLSLVRATKFLFGPYGLSCLVVLLFTIGLGILFSRRAWTSIGRVAWKITKLFFWGGPVRHTVKPNGVASPTQRGAKVIPLENKTERDVRGALEQLGYKKFEIDPVMAEIEITELASGVKAALALLKKAS